MLNVFDDVKVNIYEVINSSWGHWKGKFLNTKAEYLLGNALDQCWEGVWVSR